MCCLFGLIDIKHRLSGAEKARIISILAEASEARGIDATGYAYNSQGKLVIEKQPLPAHRMKFHIPQDAYVIMGHTRMTTQGSALRNENNHPFTGCAGNTKFTLAHNGILYNDIRLRRKLNLPTSKIETDSYVAVQLLERFDAIDFQGLKFMAEQLEGTFTITALTERDELYITKGNNPICVYHYPDTQLYVYASTEEILKKAILKTLLPLGKVEKVSMVSGEILRIDAHGKIRRRPAGNLGRSGSRLACRPRCGARQTGPLLAGYCAA